ncbi:MAG: hypothetical protein R3D67_19920 [Hyphomicrobiaceae bacterium]
MKAFSYSFVALVFTVLAAAFIVSTGSVIWEFYDTGLISMLTAHSYLFIFFPTLGIVALVAFYIPAVVFTDLYVQHARHGKLRFAIGTAVVVVLSLGFADWLNQNHLRSIWEISPTALQNNKAAPPLCREPDGNCPKPILTVLDDLRAKALTRSRISQFIRDCEPDPLMEISPQRRALRYCFPAGKMLDAPGCCAAQKAFSQEVFGLWANVETRSQAARLDRYLLPFKCFFIIVIMLIGILLVGWKKTLRRHYGPYLKAMERGLQIGAGVMLFWPVMDYAYQQTSDVLYGAAGQFPLRLSLVVLPWALILTGYFADRIAIELPNMVRAVGGAFSVIAFLRYDAVNDWSSKAIGHGASEVNFIILIVVSIALIVLLLYWLTRASDGIEPADTDDDTQGPEIDGRPMT